MNLGGVDRRFLQTPTIPDTRQLSQQKLKAVSKEFESLFLNTLFQSMQTGLGQQGFFQSSSVNGTSAGTPSGAGSFAQSVYRDMLTNEYAKAASQQGGIGLADMVYESLRRSV